MEKQSSSLAFNGELQIWQHASNVTKTNMRFAVYDPKKEAKPTGYLLWLSGLTCNENNFVNKSAALEYLQQRNIMLFCPDTSPRGLNLPGEHDSWDFGSAAGFYVNATTPGYRDHYRMYDYVNEEFYELIKEKFSVESSKLALSGHSMGGHGALIIGLRNTSKYKSVSAFSPIVHPSVCPWGRKAFAGYLGDDEAKWKEWDASELLVSGVKRGDGILVDQGSKDEFLEKQLLTSHLQEAANQAGQKITINMREGYDHSYYFISTFIESHIDFHFPV